MRRPCLGIVVAAVVAASALAVPRVSQAQQASAANRSRSDSLAATLVELELHRVSVSQEDAATIDSRIATLHAQLRALPQGEAADREATTRVVHALDARADTLEARLRQARDVFTDAHPEVRRIINEHNAITERRAELVKAK